MFFYLPIFLVLVLCVNILPLPLRDARLVPTQGYGYNEDFLFVEREKRVYLASFQEGTFISKKLVDFPEKPDKIQHFPLEGGHLLAALFHEEKKLYLYALGYDGEIYYRRRINLPEVVRAFDLRLDDRAEIIGLFYSLREKDNMHRLQLMEGKNFHDFLITDFPPEDIFLQLSENAAHALTRIEGLPVWVKTVRGRLSLHYLPFWIQIPKFFLWRGRLYLVGLDTRNNLYRFSINAQGRVVAERIFYRQDLHFAQSIIPIAVKGKLNFFLSFPSLRQVLRLEIDDFENLQGIRQYTRPLVFEFQLVLPLLSTETGLHLLEESSLGHIYWEEFDKLPLVYDVNYRVDLQKNPPEIVLFWRANEPLTYNYFFDKNKDTEPLPENKIIPKRQIIYRNLEEGDYVFHLQASSLKKKEGTPLYHIPIPWRYYPQEPKIIFLNELAPLLVPAGKIELYITNPYPGTYFGEISTTPELEPSKEISFTKDGRITLEAKLRPGSYYLHLRLRDPRSGQYSPTLHQIFFVDTYNPDTDPALSLPRRSLSQIEILHDEIRKNRYSEAIIRQKARELDQKAFPNLLQN
ncbi:MAG: hypothetical protein NZM25_07605 [Leptospiraceae bacterium]|nr:hypothetical protein [Leptospiraceae bacterium]MDW8305464.1 hypothetical protein [Leptospiraceae bacterium]